MSDSELRPYAGHRAAALPLDAAPSPGPVDSPLRKVHRNLRGRYVWAVLLGILGTTAGAYAGWKSQVPLYRAEGIIYIAPSMPSPQDPAGLNVLPMFRGFVAFQVRVLESLNATHLAMESDAWRKAGGTLTPEAIATFVARRAIVHEYDTQHVQIMFTDAKPEVALAGVRALIEAYEKLSAEENAKDERLAFAATRTDVLTAQLKDAAGQILKITGEYGGVEGLEIRHRAAVEEMVLAEQDLQKLLAEIRVAEAAGSGKALEDLTAGQIAVEDRQLGDRLFDLQLAEARETLLALTEPETSDPRKAAHTEIEIRRRWISQFVDDFNRKRRSARMGGQTLDDLKIRRAAGEERVAALRDQSQTLGNKRVEFAKRQDETKDLALRLEQMKALKDQLAAQLVGKGRIQIADSGRLPSAPFADRRKSMGMMGGLLGGGLGVLFVLLLGIRDRRFRHTDDVGSALSRVRLLGLMPTLPADLSDPRSREIAVHCVHQIRTLLQIGSARDHGSAICVTGPGVATGKTTLSLALGLSFGTSGTRTLLVDADLSGRGLTRRVGRMLFAHLQRVADGRTDETGPDAAGLGSDRYSRLLDPLDQRRAGQERVGPEEVLDLLTRAIGRLGFAGAREAGVAAQVFDVADLLFQGEARADLGARLDKVLQLAAAEVGEVLPVRVRRLELSTDRSEINGDPLDRYTYPTGIETLRFLPLRGLGTGGGVSAATVERILGRVRREVDVALVDTGPVLGAVETPMVAAHSDTVLLVVSPSDHRPEAERVVAQMEALGARIAGVVFNRAGSRDVLRASRSRSSAAVEDGGA